MRLLDHGIALVPHHDGAAVDAFDHLAGSRRDMLQAHLLFDLLAGSAEFALLENDQQIAAEADSLPLLICQPLLDEPRLALGKALPDVHPEPTCQLLRLIAGHLAVEPCRAVMVRELFERPDGEHLNADRQVSAFLPFVAFSICQLILADHPTAIGLSIGCANQPPHRLKTANMHLRAALGH